ncbi:MAG: FAD-binding oxidoreductase [Methanobacteriota archaeon]|nr:MAG: FAD-binding oxidoreductase [Euryarchaeota archaeon]
MSFISELKSTIGDEKVLTDPAELYVYGADWSPRTSDEIMPPEVVVQPKTTRDVQRTVKVAHKHEVPVTAGGGLTGMLGGAVAMYGGIYIDSTTMNSIIEIDPKNQTVRVQAGATLQKVNDEVNLYGLWLPHQPESKWVATVGAAIACDNDSTFGVRYGKILNCLLSAQVVTGTGEVLELGHRKAHFTSSGYKLKDLLAGSEGTLGVITEATLKLEPIPEARTVDMLVFHRMGSAVDYLSRLLKAGLCIEAAHINCKRRLKFYTHAYSRKHGRDAEIPQWAEALLAIAFAGDERFVDIQRSYALKIAEEEFEAEAVQEREIVDSWWASKYTLDFEPFKQKWPDSQRTKKFGAADPGVPVGRLEEFYHKFVEVAEKHGLEIIGMNAYLEHPNSIGFSLSCAVFVDYRNAEEIGRFREFHDELSKLAIAFEGTMSTFMSDTHQKAPYMEAEHGPSLAYMREIKRLFDPKGILNPGKKFIREGR